MKRIFTGEIIPKRQLMAINTKPVDMPDANALTHLQFRRFAGSPFCSVHLRSFVRRHDEITAMGIREVVTFRSTVTELQRHYDDLPFAIVAAPPG